MIAISEFQLVLMGTSFELRLLHKNTPLNMSLCEILLGVFAVVLCAVMILLSLSLTHSLSLYRLLRSHVSECVLLCVSFKVFYCVIFRNMSIIRSFFSLCCERWIFNESPPHKHCVIKQVHLLGNLSRELDTVLFVLKFWCMPILKFVVSFVITRAHTLSLSLPPSCECQMDVYYYFFLYSHLLYFTYSR